MSDAFFFAIILIVVASIAVSKTKNTMKKNASPVRKHAEAAPSAQTANPPSPAPAAVIPNTDAQARPASLERYSPGFVSMENQAIETDWHDAVMTGEGTDPCHDEMYIAPAVDHDKPQHTEITEEAREWARAVVMAEIMKRPSERRWGARGRP